MRYNAAALVVILLAAAGMSYPLSMPWVGRNDYASAQIALIARNHLEHGFGVTRLLNVSRVDRNDPSELAVYSHRPVLFPIVLSLVLAVFGAEEWAARLFVVTLSAGGGWLLYRLMARTADPAAGVLAAFFYMFAPANLFYGRVVSLTQGIVFFIIAIIWAYYRWFDSRSARDYALLIVVLILGMLTNWQAYYFAAILPVHYWLCRGQRGATTKLAGLALLGPLMFALVLAHVLVLFPREANELWDIFRFRAGWMSQAEQVDYYSSSVEYSVLGFAWVVGKHLVSLITIPLLLLALVGAAVLGRRFSAGRGDRGHLSAPAVLIAPALFHTVLFHNTMYIHDYLVLLYLPAIAALAGIGTSVMARDARFGRLTAWLALATCAIFLWLSLMKTAALHGEDNVYPLAIGMAVAESTDEHDDVIVLGTVYHPAIEWYADRNVYFVDHDGPIEQIASRRKCVAAVLKWTPEWVKEMANADDTSAMMLADRTREALRFIEEHGRPVRETKDLTIYSLEEVAAAGGDGD